MQRIGSAKAPTAALAAVLILFALDAGAAGAAMQPPPAPLRPSFHIEVPAPPAPVTIAGLPRLVYELHLANFAREALVLERVEVLAASNGGVLADLRGDVLDRLVRPGTAPAGGPQRAIASGMHAVLYLELTLNDGARPRELEHRVTYRVPGQGETQVAVVQGGAARIAADPPVALGPPLRGGPWVAVYHPSWERGHRRVVYAVGGRARIPGRFAIDWIKLDPDGRLARGDEDVVRNWIGYGAEVLAVADAVVAAARDDVAESATVSAHADHPLEDATGNYVALDLGGDRYAFYEHLAPGSVRVRPGDRVRRGQVIGALGFTGHSTGPHLHFHVADAPSPLAAEGMPFVIEEFDVLGSYGGFGRFGGGEDPAAGLAQMGQAPWVPLDAAMPSRRTRELPAPYLVVDFGPR